MSESSLSMKEKRSEWHTSGCSYRCECCGGVFI